MGRKSYGSFAGIVRWVRRGIARVPRNPSKRLPTHELQISQFDDDRFVYVRQFVKIGNQESWFYFAKNKKELQSNESILPREPNHLGGAIKKLEFTPEPVLVSLRHVRIDPPSPFLLNKWIFLRRQFMTIGKFSEVIGGYFCRVHVCFIAYVPHGTCTWSPCRHFSLLEIGSRIERWGEEKDY